MKIYDFLKTEPERLPEWLDGFAAGDPFPGEAFFASRVVYYPGSGWDGHPVKLFGSTHSAHSFVYADYGIHHDALIDELDRNGFRGYQSIARVSLRMEDLTPRGWTAHIRQREAPQRPRHFADSVAASPYGFLEVLERSPELDDEHGARRLAILFIGADGIASYDALFCQNNGRPPPFVLVLQDHGFSGNYSPFGGGGLLERIARRCNVMPHWLWVAENTKTWRGFRRLPGPEGAGGGQYNHLRYLHHRMDAEE